MKEKSVIRFAKMQISRRAALLRAFHVNESGDRTWVATSSPMHKLAATVI